MMEELDLELLNLEFRVMLLEEQIKEANNIVVSLSNDIELFKVKYVDG
jgi:hypothetical protein